ncbi:MAG: non-ribosomal peptide synthetase [Lacrimispora saccharolytica]
MESYKDKVAVVFKNQLVSYGMLEKEIDKRKAYLSTLEVKKGIIGLLFSRGIEYIYWMLAVLKSGLCFLPINKETTAERMHYIIENSGLDVIITDEPIILEKRCIVCDEIYFSAKKQVISNKTKNNLAYIMYTSGTTGKPKGVMISNLALKHFLNYFLKDKVENDHIFLANTAYTFDISIVEILLPLYRRATVYMTSDEEQKNPRKVAKLLEKYKFDWVQFTPTYLLLLVQNGESISYLNNVKNIIVGGEKVPRTLAVMLKENTECNLYNAYGPTEMTIWTHIGDLRDDFINVGYAIPGVYDLILDDNFCETDKGNLWLSGKTISNGYVNDNALNEKKFVTHNGILMYDSGDVAYRKEGKLVIAGRCDNQIKISGKRVELEEIENLIVEYTNISQCIVMEAMGEIIIVIQDRKLTREKLIAQLIGKIDNSFIPKKIMYINEFPILSNGKTDRRKVREMYMENSYLENRIMDIIEKIAMVEFDKSISFKSLGVSSLEYVTLIVKVEKVFGIEFEDEALVMENFETIEKFIDYVCSLVEKKEEQNAI